MKKMYLFMLVLLLSVAAKAQTAASYAFARTTGTYTSIVGGSGTVSTTSISSDDATLSSISIGFSFVYCGTTYTTLSACSNGWLSLTNSTANVWTNTMSGAANGGVGKIMPFWDDLNGSGRTAYYQTTGTAPNRVFTFQWGDPSTPWGTWTGSGTATFQVKIYESSNVIQYVYGTGSYSGSSATIGIANSATDILNLANQSSTTATTTFSSSVSGSPAANSVMTWTPPPTILTSASALTFTTLVSTTAATQTVNISGYGFTSSPVTLTVPTNFEIYNTTTSSWTTSYTIATSSAAVGTYIPSTAVQVRFNAPSTTGTTTGNLAMTGAGLATATNVGLTGNATNPCAGTPTGGTASVSPAVGNASTSFSLSASGYTVAAGIAYQWQSSADNTSWSNITGATNATYGFTGISTSTYYRVNIICTNSSLSAPSASVLVSYLPASSCTPAYYYSPATTYKMNNFSLTGHAGSNINDNGPTTAATNGYEDRTAAVAAVDLMQATSYSGNITYNSSYYFQSQVWIDFNNNGTFENSEKVTPVINGSFVTSVGYTLTIPAGVSTGYRRMRVRTGMTYNSVLSTLFDPCTYYDQDYYNYSYYGTTRDYVANIVPQPVCAGTPTAGTVTAGTILGCGSISTTLATTGATSGFAGLTYQWQSSPDNTSWTNIAGATSSTAAVTLTSSTYYRRQIGCTASAGTNTTVATQLVINPLPSAITGNTLVCAGSTTTLASATPGGTWTSSNTTVANINSSTGIATIGSSAGYALISYTLTSTGCRQVTAININTLTPTVTASASPSTICSGGNTTLSASSSTTLPTYYVSAIPYSPVAMTSPTTLSWASTDDDYATISLPFSFNYFGTSYSTVYIVTNGYLQFASPYQYNYGYYPMPDPNLLSTEVALFHRDLNVSGAGGSVSYSTEGTAPNRRFVVRYNNVCDYGSSAGGNTGEVVLYETSNKIEMHVQSTTYNDHVVAGIQNATGTVGYVAPNRNYSYFQVSAPEAWSFNTSSMQYTWSPATSLSSTTGTSVSATNLTATPGITYSVAANYNGCAGVGTAPVVVNPVPAAITGTAQVCAGLTTAFATTSTGGTWTSGTTSVATVGATTGTITGVAAGTSLISYTFGSTGCRSTRIVTVNALPANITGTASACVGATANLSNATAGGTWSSGTTGIATVGAVSGVVSGVSAGLTIITYTLPTGCIKTVEGTINPLPVTTITPSAAATVCQGEGSTFTAFAPQPAFSILLQDFNSGLGTWSINTTSGDPASAWRFTTAPSSGISGDGTTMLESDAQYAIPTTTMLTSPTFSTIGYSAATVTFNQYLISVASSDANVDVDYSIDGGATWVTVFSQVGLTSGTGAWTSTSTPEASIALPAGALGQSSVKLRWHYNSNFGLYWDIDNIKVLAYQPDVTYAWSGISGATGLSCAACATTTITPGAVGTNAYSVTSTTASGCTSNVGVTVSVNPLPVAITGTMVLCANTSTTLSNTDAGGTWSSADATVSVDAASGVISGVSAGTALITYTLPTGCRATAAVSINPIPTATTGVLQVCEGNTTTLSNTTPGGLWSSGFAGIATVDAMGVVNGIAPGSVDIHYTLSATGCMYSVNVSVNPTPAPITGTMQVCEGLTTALANADAGGTWTSATTSVATIGATSGVASGLVAGSTIITYQLPTGCINTATLVVNALPATITGTMQVCHGLTATLASATTGGTWSSSAAATATVDAMGVVTGVAPGNAIVTYTLATSCITTANVVVNPLPAAIGGTLQVCQGLTTALSNTDAGGTWASGSTGVATISTSGVATGVAAGASTITYTLPTGCINTANLVVDPLPANITGSMQVCEGLTTTLANATAGGTWATSAPGVASVDMMTGVVTGLFAGVTTITYQLPTGCIKTADVVVNALPAGITGATQLCQGLSTALASMSPGGAWSSGTPATATVSTSGVVTGLTAGTTTITYTLSTTCITTTDVLVNPTPDAITGVMQVCEGLTTTLSSTSAGGQWTSSAAGVASIDMNTGVISGITSGIAAITYTLPTTCLTSSNVTVNALPSAITGAPTVCVGASTVLNNATFGGAWTSGATGIATIASATGAVTGIAAGNAAITYTLPTGCIRTSSILVNALPAPITGTMQVCIGSATGLSNADAGGTWSSSVPGIATVASGTGLVSGISMGNAVISYILPTGCRSTAVMMVNPLPAPIAGVTQLCEGTMGALSNGTPGGTWSSSTAAVATIDGTGTATALASGTTLITYTLPTGCLRSRTLVVNAQPAPIVGATQICQTNTTTLANATAGGFWSSSALLTATVSSGGVVSGINAGTSGITYMLPTGCRVVSVMTVNTLPEPISGTLSACEGQTTMLSDVTTGGSWSSSSINATVDATGLVTGVSAGSATIVYELPTGCSATANVVVNVTPAPIAGLPQICQGTTTALTNATTGGVWSSSAPGIAGAGLHTGIVSGIIAGSANISYTMLTGCYRTASMIVNALPAPIAGSLNVCNGQSSALGSATTGGVWSSSNTAIATVSAGGMVTSVATGTTTINYSLATGCSRSAIVSVNAVPAIHNVTGGGNYCAGGTGVSVGLDGSNTGTRYQLYDGAATVGLPLDGFTGASLDFGLISAAGTYSVVARNASTGCASAMTGAATVSVATPVVPGVTVTTAASSFTVCNGAVTTFTGAPVNGGTTPAYQWLVNGSAVAGATNGTYAYTPANGDVVSLNMTSSAACAAPAMATTSHTMTVNASVMPSATITSTSGLNLCAGTPATFTVAAVYGGTAPAFVWMKNGIVAGTGSGFAYTPADGDNISLKMASNYACRLADTVSSGTLSMAVIPMFVPSVSISADPGFSVKNGTSVTLTATVSGGGAAPLYQWYVGTSLIPSATNATYTSNVFNNGDSITVEVTGTGSCGLKAFNSVMMGVTPTGVATVNGGANVVLVPNPNNGQFTVRGTLATKADQEVNIEITNMLGQTVYSSKVTAGNGVINEQLKLDNTLANGMYMLNMISGAERKVFHFVLEQ
ncbi:MAG: GEVED domain-containing protein [Bacteroidota bacterium]